MTVRPHQRLQVVGRHTYSCRDQLKSFGAVWEPVLNAWIFLAPPTADVMEKVARLGLRLEEL